MFSITIYNAYPLPTPPHPLEGEELRAFLEDWLREKRLKEGREDE